MEDKKLNRGALYNSTDKIFKGGKINVNGNDQQFLVSEYTNKEGKKKFPIYVNVGYFNINTKKNKVQTNQMFMVILNLILLNLRLLDGNKSRKEMMGLN